MNQPPPAPSARAALWERLLPILLPVVLLSANLGWHLGHPAPSLTGHNHPLNVIAQLRDFDAAPLRHLAMFPHGHLPPHFSLYHLSARLTVAVLGKNHLGLVLISTLYLLVLGAAVYRLTTLLADRRAGLTAMIFALSTPALLGWSRVLAPNIAVATWPAVGLWLLVESRGLARPAPALAFAALAALAPVLGETAGDAMQLMLVFAVAGGYALLLPPAGESRTRRRALLTVGAMAVVFIALLNTIRLEGIIAYVQTEGVELADSKYGAGNVFRSPLALLSYPALLWGHDLWPGYALLALAAVLFALRRPDRKNGLALLWFLVPLTVYTLLPKKDVSYLLAALPAPAVLAGLAAARLTKPAFFRAALALVLVLGLGNHFWSLTRPSPSPETWSPLITRHVHVGGEYLRLPSWGAGAQVMTLAENAAAATPADAGLLFLARLDSSDAAAIRYHLMLADWRGRLRLHDPLSAIENEIVAAHSAGIASGPERVTVALVLPDERGLLHGRNFTSAAEFRAYFARRNMIALLYPEPEDRAELADETARALAAVRWDDFHRREWLGRGVTAGTRLRVEVYDRPDRGVSVDLPSAYPPR